MQGANTLHTTHYTLHSCGHDFHAAGVHTARLRNCCSYISPNTGEILQTNIKHVNKIQGCRDYSRCNVRIIGTNTEKKTPVSFNEHSHIKSNVRRIITMPTDAQNINITSPLHLRCINFSQAEQNTIISRILTPAFSESISILK